MRFDILTVFPGILDSYFKEAQLGKAVMKGKIEIFTHDLRNFTKDRHRTTDDTPYGGGAGMLMKIEPIYECLREILESSPVPRKKIRVLLMSPKGKIFNSEKAKKLAGGFKQIIFICGRYEGIDERVTLHLADEEISLGNYVLSGGELPAAVVLEAVSRFIPGFLGNPKSLEEESHEKIAGEYPQYTRPEVFRGWKVPEILFSGNHQEIKSWRQKNQKK